MEQLNQPAVQTQSANQLQLPEQAGSRQTPALRPGAGRPGSRGAALTTLPGQLRSMTQDHGFTRLHSEGQLPDGLRGTLLRNGPGLFEAFGARYSHLFEGDGAIAGVRLTDRGALGAHRLVQSRERAEELRAGKALYGSVASWPRRLANGLGMKLKNTANTNLLSYQGRLLALMEAAHPTELDPETLDTLGPTSFGDVLQGPFSAHPHRVAGRQATYNFGVSYGRVSSLDIYELPDSGAPRRLTSLTLAKPVMLHDFIATQNHLVFLVAPAEVQVWRALLGIGSFTDIFQWRAEHGTEVIVVPIDDPEHPIRFRTESFYQWHFAGAYEAASSPLELVLDLVAYRDFSSFNDLEQGAIADPGHYERVRISPSCERLSRERLWDKPCEFPRIDPRFEGREFSQAWLLTAQDGQSGIARFDNRDGAVEEFVFPHGTQASEPVFVPRSSSAPEGDGWLLSLVYDPAADRSHLAVLDNRELCAGPVYRAFFDHHVPITFHGIWLPER